jgi:hypothetical protein
MNALRKFCAAILLSSLSVLALGAFAAPAQAGQPYCGPYGCHKTPVYCNTLHFYPTSGLCGNYCRTTTCLPTYNCCPKPTCYPVTLYDCFGRPYVVYQTGYSAFLR